MQHVHAQKDSKLTVLNRYKLPVGPTKAIVAELGSFLGTLARNAMFCPLHINKWNHVDTKQDLWEYTLDKYNIPDAEQRWVLDGIQSARRKYKNHLYRKRFKHFDNDDLRLANKPDDVSEYAFKDLLKYWHSNEFKAKIEKVQSDKQSEDGSQSIDTCAAVLGPEHSGFVRLYGRGVTKTALKWKGYLEPSASTSNEM